MSLFDSINITIKGLRDVRPTTFSLNNQNENKATKLIFNFENEELNKLFKYIVFTHSMDEKLCYVVPLLNNEFLIRNNISSVDGQWNMQLIFRDLELDLDKDIIELETLNNDELTIISKPITCRVKKTTFNAEVIENMPMDENLQIIYDDLLKLKVELESSGFGVADVKINNTSIVNDGVANIPMASINKLGVVQTKRNHGIMMTQDGYIYPMPATESEISNRDNYRWLTPSNIDYAIKTALTDGKGAEWDTTEQANAKKRIGIDRDLEFLSNAIEGKTTQPYIDSNFKTSLTDSDKGLMKNIDVRGKTTQIQYTGKNLLNVPQTLTFTQYKSLSDLYISSGTYALSFGTVTSGGENPPTARFMYEDGTEYAWHTLYSNKTYKINTTQAITKIHLYSNGYTSSDGAGIDCTLENLQLEVGETATSYEPYVGGIPSPNLDYPQEMVRSNKLDITVCGKNLFNPNNMTKGFLPQNGEYPTNNATFSNASYQLIRLKANDVITISVIGEDSKSEGRLRVIDNETNKVVNSVSSNVEGYCTSTNNFGSGFVNGTITALKGFTLGILSLYDDVGEVYNLQIEYGSTATEYEPYTEQVISHELPISMKSTLDGQFYDYIDLDRGKLVQVMQEVTFNGSESWYININYTTNEMNVFQLYVDDSSSGYANSDCFIYDSVNKIGTIRNGGKHIMCSVSSSKFSTIDEWKVFLQNNPITVSYLLETPIEHDLPQELINQLKALYSYYGATNVISSLPIKFDYKLNMPSWYGIISKTVSDTRNIIYDMETQTLQNSIDTTYLQMMMEEGVM